MKFNRSAKTNRRTEERILVIVDLGIRRDRILEAPELDLEALTVLVADYEDANMPCAAEDLRKRLEYYRSRHPKQASTVSLYSIEKDNLPTFS